MPPRQPKAQSPKQVESFTHEESRRKHIPTAEFQSVMAEDEKRPIQVDYDLRNRDLDPLSLVLAFSGSRRKVISSLRLSKQRDNQT